MLFFFVLLSSTSFLYADSEGNSPNGLHVRLFSNTPKVQEPLACTSFQPMGYASDLNKKIKMNDEKIAKKKSKTVAILLSAAIPGAGEIYCGGELPQRPGTI